MSTRETADNLQTTAETARKLACEASHAGDHALAWKLDQGANFFASAAADIRRELDRRSGLILLRPVKRSELAATVDASPVAGQSSQP